MGSKTQWRLKMYKYNLGSICQLQWWNRAILNNFPKIKIEGGPPPLLACCGSDTIYIYVYISYIDIHEIGCGPFRGPVIYIFFSI